MRDSCGSSGTVETPQAFTPRRLTALPAESEHLEGKSTTSHYLVNSNKVFENSLYFLIKAYNMKELIIRSGQQINHSFLAKNHSYSCDGHLIKLVASLVDITFLYKLSDFFAPYSVQGECKIQSQKFLFLYSGLKYSIISSFILPKVVSGLCLKPS